VGPKDDPAAFLVAVGEAIRHFRARLGISQEELSFRAELDRTYMSGVERGVRNPTVKSLLRITKALGVRPSAVLKRAEERGNYQREDRTQ
jgi:transcriptional regulator with XRE-family HTH domain